MFLLIVVFALNSAFHAWRHGWLVVNKLSIISLLFSVFYTFFSLYNPKFPSSLFLLLLRPHKAFDKKMTAPRTIINKLGMISDKCHQAAWQLKDPSNLAVTRILFGKFHSHAHMHLLAHDLLDCACDIFRGRLSYGCWYPFWAGLCWSGPQVWWFHTMPFPFIWFCKATHIPVDVSGLSADVVRWVILPLYALSAVNLFGFSTILFDWQGLVG